MLKHDLYPAYALSEGHIEAGYAPLAAALGGGEDLWIFDGPSSIDWQIFRQNLTRHLAGQPVVFLHAQEAHIGAEAGRQKSSSDLETGELYYGRLHDGSLSDFFDPERLKLLEKTARQQMQAGRRVIVYGTGSSLLSLPACKAWVDLPYEHLRKLASDGDVKSLAGYAPLSEKSLINIDYPLLDEQRALLLPVLELYVDFRDLDNPLSLRGEALRNNLYHLAEKPFRAVPAVYTSMWGGQHLRSSIEQMQDYPRCSHYYALFPPVNTIRLRDGERVMEIPFEVLMHLETHAVQGSQLAAAFGARMPVRFTLMDTIEGQNLSHQIHPGRAQACELFNTDYDEPETYFILQTAEGGQVYLGLRNDADPAQFREAVRRAHEEQIGFELSEYVNTFPTKSGMAVHVPSRVVHNAGANNLILEVTTHPIGHTYRLYDFMRRTQEGKLRPLHVEGAFMLFDQARDRSWIEKQGLFPERQMMAEGEERQVQRLSAPPLTRFVNDEITFTNSYADDTRGERFHLLLSVQGDQLRVESKGSSHPLHQYETIIVPASTGAYRLVNDGDRNEPCKVYKVYVSSVEAYHQAEI